MLLDAIESNEFIKGTSGSILLDPSKDLRSRLERAEAETYLGTFTCDTSGNTRTGLILFATEPLELPTGIRCCDWCVGFFFLPRCTTTIYFQLPTKVPHCNTKVSVRALRTLPQPYTPAILTSTPLEESQPFASKIRICALALTRTKTGLRW